MRTDITTLKATAVRQYLISVFMFEYTERAHIIDFSSDSVEEVLGAEWDSITIIIDDSGEPAHVSWEPVLSGRWVSVYDDNGVIFSCNSSVSLYKKKRTLLVKKEQK